jgi:chromate transporter
MTHAPGVRNVCEVARVALRLGLTAFGGPAVHIAMLREEVVVRRRWMTDDEFVDLLGATNLIPGPNSTEMVIHAGFRRAGWAGFAVGGILFILPAAAIVLAFAWAYVEYGKTPAVEWVLYGIKPVVIAIVVQAIWGLARSAVKNVWLAVVGVASLALYLAGINELLILFGFGALALLARSAARQRGRLILAALPATEFLGHRAIHVAPDLTRLFLIFLKIGSVLYGSGYVLLAFLQGEFVDRLGWLTQQQLLDAVAVGQFTPGPVFTTATFIGYVIGGWSGAALATVGIFLPSFLFVAISQPLIPRLRKSPVAAALLDGVNVAALGLMAGVTWQLGRGAVMDAFTLALAVGAAVVLLRWKINSAWLVLAGALAALGERMLSL